MSTLTALPPRHPLLQAIARGTGPVAAAETSGTRWADWPPELLWLWPTIDNTAVQTRMHQVIKQAIATMPQDSDPTGIVLLHELHRAARHAATLRLSARLLRGTSADDETTRARDLAACCLLLAAVKHDDALGAIEFAAFAERQACLTDGEVGLPGLDTANRLARRMRRQGRIVLAHRFSFPGREGFIASLVRTAAADPLAHYLGYAPASSARGIATDLEATQ